MSENNGLELLSSYICRKSGILIPPHKAYLFETRLSKMLAETDTETFSDFYNYLISGRNPVMEQNVIDAMTTNETMWFRDLSPWKVLEENILPGLTDGLQTGKINRARIWFAAVSSGQEAYSTVMCVDNYLKKNKITDITLSDFEFFATDISRQVLKLAETGRYNAISMARGLDEYYKKNYFTEDGAAWNIRPEIKNAVTFRHFNLKLPYESFGFFNVIFCRYVLIYFADDFKKEVMSKLHGSLTDNGILFTGNYALFDFVKDEFGVNHYDNLTYYTKKAMIK